MAANSQKTAKRRGRGKPFQPGQSGNPTGRPKLTPEMVQLREIARTYTHEAVDTLAEIMRDKEAPASARAGASSELLDRGWGRSPAVVEGNVLHDHEHHHVHESVSETAQWVEDLLGADQAEQVAKSVQDGPVLPAVVRAQTTRH